MKEPNEFTGVQKQLSQILTRNFFYTINFWEEVFFKQEICERLSKFAVFHFTEGNIETL